MINRLNEMLVKKGDKFISHFLNEILIISEKLDTHRIQFEKNNGIITFYTKDNKKIDKIIRTLNNLWEDACIELPILIENADVLEGYRYGLYYTPLERPLRVPYSKIPKYILTDVTKRDKNKIVENLSHAEIEKWAGKLCMGKPPVIFKGDLSEDQKQRLIDYETRNYLDKSNFAELVKELFGSTYSKEPMIEGIILQSSNNLAQIISYEFDILNEAYEQNTTSRDFYDLIILSINKFMQTYAVPVLESNDSEINYINVICDIFNKYCEAEHINENTDPKYLTPLTYGEAKNSLNKKFISDKKTLEILSGAPIYESLFKVFLSSFRKPKKPFGLLDESNAEKFNVYVYLINNYVYKNNTEPINEAVSNNTVISSVQNRQVSDIDNMRVIASIQRAFTPREVSLEKGKVPAVVYITSYTPFTQSQFDNILNIKKQWNCNVIIGAVSNKNRMVGKKFYLSDELVTAQMKTIQDFNRDLVEGYIMLDSWSILEVFEFCRPKYEPVALITDMYKKSELALQLFFEEEVMSKRLDVEDRFNIGEMENKDALPALRAVEDENFSLFNELVYAPIKNYYNNIINEYKLWSGAVLKQ